MVTPCRRVKKVKKERLHETMELAESKRERIN